MDCHRLVQRLRGLRDGATVPPSGAAPAPSAHTLRLRAVLEEAAWRAEAIARHRGTLVRLPRAGHAWHADHVVEVADGGGEAALDNVQTLCVPCHLGKTKRSTAARSVARRRAAAEASKKTAEPWSCPRCARVHRGDEAPLLICMNGCATKEGATSERNGDDALVASSADSDFASAAPPPQNRAVAPCSASSARESLGATESRSDVEPAPMAHEDSSDDELLYTRCPLAHRAPSV